MRIIRRIISKDLHAPVDKYLEEAEGRLLHTPGAKGTILGKPSLSKQPLKQSPRRQEIGHCTPFEGKVWSFCKTSEVSVPDYIPRRKNKTKKLHSSMYTTKT